MPVQKKTSTMESRNMLAFAMLIFGMIALGAPNKMTGQTCRTCFNPSTSTYLPFGGNLSTSGIPGNMGGIFITSGPHCVHVGPGATLTVDEVWVLNDVCFSLEQGARIVVAPSMLMEMTGGNIYEPWGGQHNGIEVGSNSALECDGVNIYNALTAITGNGSHHIFFENGLVASSQRALFLTGGIELQFNGNNVSGVVKGVECLNTQTIQVMNNQFNNVMDFGVVADFSGNVSITGNDIITNGQFNPTIGISVTRSSIANISGNTGDINGANWGIFTSQIDGLTISGNTIDFTDFVGGASSTPATGISVQSCGSINVSYNTLTSQHKGGNEESTLFTYGLDLSNASGIVAGNIMNTMDVGAQIRGTCGLTDNFDENEFHGSMSFGLLVRQSSIMGSQNCGGNLWMGVFSGNGAKCEGGQACATNNGFLVGGGIGEMPPNPEPSTFWFNSGFCFTGGGGTGERSSNLPKMLGEGEILEVAIFPNPARNFLNILMPNTEIEMVVEIRDLAGKLVYSEVISANTELVEIDISSIGNGLYLLNIISEDFNHTDKVVVSR